MALKIAFRYVNILIINEGMLKSVMMQDLTILWKS